MTDFKRSYWSENFRRTLRSWDDAQNVVSIVLVIVGFLGYGALAQNGLMVKIGVGLGVLYLAARFLVLSPLSMWKDAQREIIAFNERLEPRMSFVFEPETPPYVQHFILRSHGSPDRKVRICRVGIRNDSAAIIPRVRVVVESIVMVHNDGQPFPPNPDESFPTEHALQVMGIDKKDGTVDLSPGDRPTAYVDVAEHMTTQANSPDDWFSLCYANGFRAQMHRGFRWHVGLRAEGGGTYQRARYLIEWVVNEQKIEMRPLG